MAWSAVSGRTAYANRSLLHQRVSHGRSYSPAAQSAGVVARLVGARSVASNAATTMYIADKRTGRDNEVMDYIARSGVNDPVQVKLRLTRNPTAAATRPKRFTTAAGGQHGFVWSSVAETMDSPAYDGATLLKSRP